MDIFLIKRESEIKEIIDDYFFNYVENSAFESKTFYFQNNNLISKKDVFNYYYDLPFILLKRILKSIESGTGEFILNSIYIPSILWSNTFYNEDKIPNYFLKYELFRILTIQINTFIENYHKHRKINKDIYQNLCNALIEFQLSFSKEIWYINTPEYFTKNNYLNDNNLDSYLLIYKNTFFSNSSNGGRNFLTVLTNFIKSSLYLNTILNISDYSNYDFEDDSILMKEKEYLENKKMIISKFYVNTVLKIIIRDMKSLILKRIKSR